MTRLEEMQALEAAIAILRARKMELAAGSNAVYSIVYRAQDHLNDRLAAMLRGGD